MQYYILGLRHYYEVRVNVFNTLTLYQIVFLLFNKRQT